MKCFSLKNTLYGVLSMFVICGFVIVNAKVTYAKENTVDIEGTVYEFDEDTEYVISDGKVSQKEPYGKLSVSGQMASPSDKDGIKSICFSGDSQNKECLTISYTYNDSLLKASEEEWHLIDDKSKKVDVYSLDKKILKGAIMVQTSKDGKIWVEDESKTNIFAESPDGISDLYSTTSVQLSNGCYYRIIVAYEVRRKVDPKKVLFLNVKQEETVRYAEIYEFYAYDRAASKTENDVNAKKYYLGELNRVDKFEGYTGKKEINSEDPHYGWKLGKFYVSGYTDTDDTGNEIDNIVFLKAVGDRVTLGFNLLQDINCLKGNSNLSIIEDPSNFDQYFETPRMNFGKGALIVRKINENNDKEPAIEYTNFLLANATVGADTKIDLFEEGDYEVALDYKLQNEKRKVLGASVLPEEANYRIYFKFSVRNANCMVYPFDVKTGGELTNSSMTENGFYLDLAKSKYLKVIVKKEVLKDGYDGLTEDTRFNQSAKAGDSFTDEGIYTITVTNPYTKQTTVKKICVGKNNVLKAHMTTGLSISEINDKLANGAIIEKDGTITDPEPVVLECVCEKKCSIDGINGKCEACLADYSNCIGVDEYIEEMQAEESASEIEEDKELPIQDNSISAEKKEVIDNGEESNITSENEENSYDSDEPQEAENIYNTWILVILAVGICAIIVYLLLKKKNVNTGSTNGDNE